MPFQTNVKLLASNGGISINSVDGTLDFETRNGGINLADVAGDVKGMTRNGGVKLVLPRNYAANVETGTVNGGFTSDFAELDYVRDKNKYWQSPKKVNASLNGGGAKVRVITRNGGVKIISSEDVR